MDALSPARACDPWAVHSAKSFEKSAPGKVDLSTDQKRILDLLVGADGLEPTVLAQRLGMTMADLEREIATLRHMERVRGELRGGRRFIRAW
jgi:DNA-binding MarR family transcriptional regulator